MGFSTGDMEQEVRFIHAAFTPHAVPGIVLARAWSGYQRVLATKATRFLPTYLSQVLNIALDLSIGNAIGTRGAGIGGFPAGPPPTQGGGGGPVDLVGWDDEDAGLAITEDLEGSALLYAPTPVSSATPTTLSHAVANWTVNAFAGHLLELIAGPGEPRVQEIGGNTATQLTGLEFSVVPTTATVFQIRANAPELLGSMDVVTNLPALSRQDGYLVKLDATGTPYIDFAAPLICKFDQGVPLPAHTRLLGAQLRWGGPTPLSIATDLPAPLPLRTSPFPIIPYGHRAQTCPPAGYVLGQDLFLIGDRLHYQGIASIELRYIPIPPDVHTARTDPFLLPDEAQDAIVAFGALIAARRVRARLAQGELEEFQTDWKDAEDAFLDTVKQKRQDSLKITRPYR